MSPRFQSAFRRAASRVRACLTARHVFTGLACGLAVAGGLALVLWRLEPGSRLVALVAPAVGIFVAMVVDRRRRLSDEHVALLLDTRLDTREVITTALGSTGSSAANAAIGQALFARANDVLSAASPEATRVPVLRKHHAIGVVGMGALAAAFALPVRKTVAPAAPPGTDLVQLTEVKGLEKAIALRTLDARDEAQRERLEKLGAEAERIRDALRKGEAKRDAEADIAKLSDGIAAERMSFGDGDERKGLESAMSTMGKNADLHDAAKALGDHDMVLLDREMERIADEAEGDARDRAKKALEEAEEAAKKAGAKGVAKSLAQQRKRLEEAERKHQALRDLARALGKGLGDDGKKALEGMTQGDPDSARKLAEALGDALDKLTPEERKRLAEKLEAKANQDGGKELGELGSKLEQPGSSADLEKSLRDLANAPPASDEARRQESLDGAQRGLDGALASPVPGAGSPGASDGNARGAPGAGSPGGASARSDSKKDASKPSERVDATELRSRAHSELGAGVPMPGRVGGRAPGRTGETANVRGTGAIGAVGPDEVGGVSRSDVPEAYREQVGRYFEP